MSKVIENELLKALNVSHATAKDDTRPILQGVNFNGNKICALDGYRMSIREIEGMNIDNDVTLYPEGVKILKNVLDKKSENEIDISGIGEDIIFYNNNMQLQLHRFNRDYVNYENLIPYEFNYEYEVCKQELLDILKKLKKEVQKDKTKGVKIIQKDNQIFIKGKDTCVNLFGARIVAKNDDEFCIACNINYLIEALKILDNGERTIRIKIVSPIQPIILTNDDKNLELVMPIRLVH